MITEIRRWEPWTGDLVHLEDGRPVLYASLGSPKSKEGEPALAARIKALTGFSVRFGIWIEVQGDPRDGGAEVPLFVIDVAAADRRCALERLLARIRIAGNIQLNYDMWDNHGREHATPAERATMEADLANASSELGAAKAALLALVAQTRTEAPAELAAWVDAHQAYLDAYLAEGASGGATDAIGASVANRERSEWAEVNRGFRAYVEESLFYVPLNAERYRRLFGIDPQTLERVDTDLERVPGSQSPLPKP